MGSVSKIPATAGARFVGPAAASLLVHVGLGFGLATSQAEAPAQPVLREVWSGETFDIDATSALAAAPASPDEASAAEAEASAPTATGASAPEAASEPDSTQEAGAPAPSSAPAAPERKPVPPAPERKPAPSALARKPSAATPSTSPSSAPAEAGSAEASAVSGAGAGHFGAAGLPPGVRDLPTAFTRAIPPAASRDAAFREHELGELGEVRVLLRLDEAGRITGSEVQRRPGEQVPPLLERLCGRIVALLGGGQFALRERTGRAAEQLLRLEIRLEAREPSLEAEPNETVRLGFDAPSDGKPGRAFFTLGSGRHFEASVQLLAAH